jgi:hypothetical protein
MWIYYTIYKEVFAGNRSRNSDYLLAGRSGDRIPVETGFSAPVQTGAEVHPASCTIGTEYFPGVRSGRDVKLTLIPSSVAVKNSVKVNLHSS